MRIAILGATGNTGIQLVIQACQRNHQVTAIVRNPDKLSTYQDKNLIIVKANNIFDADELATHLIGHDCVLSALGYPGLTLSAVSICQDAIKSIVAAMRKNSIKRFICVSSQYSKPSQSDYGMMYKFLLRPMIGRQLDDLNVMEQYLFDNCSDLDYTIVRPPGLTNDPLDNNRKELVFSDKWVSNGGVTHRMARANVAKFILDILESNEHLKKGVSIDMPK